MRALQGLTQYLACNYNKNIFNQAIQSGQLWELHLHGHLITQAYITESMTYEISIKTQEPKTETIPKLHVKILYPANIADSVKPLIKYDQNLNGLGLEPICPPSQRHYIKNKTLYPLMMEHQVVFFKLLEGEIIRGIVADFSRYDITVHLKGGLPVTLLRHSVYDMSDKPGRCYLKKAQRSFRDWQKSKLYIEQETP